MSQSRARVWTHGGRRPPPTPASAVLDAALDLFIEQGFDGTSLRQIAEQLGVTKAALYYHFESKDKTRTCSWRCTCASTPSATRRCCA